ncbi:hypothetical protein AUK11_02105 [bacterium CG2_30_37_16]|nr:MAG: hypothetical protein AUK11_02105 [bacterium CG2_30_37_16]PIP30789.1 MAG: hypothetical protein COX25_02940 [bacterium (Candidatus Howlettbacteria) CG23_combo_of_CG06-09_8_20_14_all_37_9]PIY00323.1 MAG: hypothetical protein COZ22_00530 [bacterium (Candidatus Howlettbacteria) CG_4_10_14_3_um_filter_37_10]
MDEEILTKTKKETLIPHCLNETDTLRDVIIGYPDNFLSDQGTVEIVNNTQKKYYFSDDKPTAEKLKKEFDGLELVLKKLGVNVRHLLPLPCSTGVCDQLPPRDIAFVIGDLFFICNMKRISRKREWEALKDILDLIPEDKIIRIPEGIILESGDIILDKGFVFYGIGQRSTEEGVNFLKDTLKDTKYKVIPVFMKLPKDGEECLHLDCTFGPIVAGKALIYRNGLKEISQEILDNYELIDIAREEHDALFSNVLVINSNTIIIRHNATRLIKLLTDMDIKVIPVKFDEAPKTGAGFRCCTLPLVKKQ